MPTVDELWQLFIRAVGRASRNTMGLEFDDLMNLGSRIISRVDTGRPSVALTFDDGPNPKTTSEILDRLDAAGAQATFYCVGANVLQYPSLTREIVARGHEVGSHSMTHPDFHRAASLTIWRELRASCQAIEDVTGQLVRSVRPPYVHSRWEVRPLARLLNIEYVVGADVSPPWSERDAQRLSDYVLSRVRAGSVVLLHDGHYHDSQDTSGLGAVIVSGLGAVLSGLRARGLRGVTFSELVDGSDAS